MDKNREKETKTVTDENGGGEKKKKKVSEADKKQR